MQEVQPEKPYTEKVKIQIEDDRTGTSLDTIKRAIADNLYYLQGKNIEFATPYDYYMALAYTVRDRLLHRHLQTTKTYSNQNVKTVYYLSAEFLMGRQLAKNLVNVGCWEVARQALEESCLQLHDLIEKEPEPGLGNGGLGRLAACFLDSLATLQIPAVGYGIRYEFGIFKQLVHNGFQVEQPDKWLSLGNPWEIPRYEEKVEIKLGGDTETYTDKEGNYRVRWIPERTVIGMPYDTLVPGYNTNTVNNLRLWSAKASNEFDLQVFDSGDYNRAVEDKTVSENISKVLYPNDNIFQGKMLRLEQQYFFVSCSLQDIIRTHLSRNRNLDNFHKKVAIQLNDTHPSIGVAELMRLLIDEHKMEWEKAWKITQNTFGYTNHTLLAEALERWPVSMFKSLLPRHIEIIYEINFHLLEELKKRYPGDDRRLARMSLIEEQPEKSVRMAHLACTGAHAINGVAKLHTQLLKTDVLKDFYKLWPEKFTNKTNGITPRRWLLISNPKLALLITNKIGKNWINNLEEIQQLKQFVNDQEFRYNWNQIKYENKQDLATYIKQNIGVVVNPNSLFDIQVKRLHEYKRQLLNVFHIITLYNRIKENPDTDILHRTFIFGAKAAPGYSMAKLIIKLINAVAEIVNNDPDVRHRLKIVFIPNFSVSLGQQIYPAADLSEQISTAGKEASGTGNMKFSLNGALTIGTLDGANIEIREAVGADNFFLFGLTVEEVKALKYQGYNPQKYYNDNKELRQVIDRIASGYFSPGKPDLFQPLIVSLLEKDEYMLLADYQSYIDCQEEVNKAYRNPEYWTRMSIINSINMGKFSADRTISEYCQEIWNVDPVKIDMEAYNQETAGLQRHCQI
ncbi:MAG: glycogen/starch/alpha-glucan phosphorylase [Trichodesmium sp. St16_bin4-tuft]|nr:glycogen/starch/alpha-glucan phosphorylase [Trichodesmium sp. ALOHA_ZT_67]MDE5092084.1 glycogen/starch/alpha-glucan phosphorylase [Trichodesmium sp. St18_bin3_1_1]MDE5095572.1 glycogen/starch/alpha-glucan phosphorylase [Trichodesmium sp. St11_bin5]MDE5098473.1 glycogen/starch/alpha-glucan phosphorylase [Trichodesmium sp. St16_bin4-tuft]MDE5102122.1 glycogen/starch/alpha-glucan phosphorylase [Trichodesmium sp. St19_bin2]MDT9339308.1 glycogen/starch/alpha-glucan phosphorylase [Trichodesmium e